MKEKLQEIYEGLQERLKSPFLLTFIVVWAIHNWEFVYAILTFSSDLPFVKRIAFLKTYLKIHKYDELLWFPLLWTFASIGMYFLASFLSEGINLFYNKWVRTWLYLVIDNNKLKTEEEYNSIELRRKKLQELVFDLRKKEEDAALKLKNVEEMLNKTISEQRDELAKCIADSAEKEKLVFDKNIELESAKNEIKNTRKMLEKTNLTVERLTEQKKGNQNIMSDHVYKTLKDRERFKKLFVGTWLNQYELENGFKGRETFTLEHEGEQMAFLTDKKEVLLISEIQFLDEKTLVFIKTNKNIPNSFKENVLKINNPFSLIGLENDNINITYSKVGD